MAVSVVGTRWARPSTAAIALGTFTLLGGRRKSELLGLFVLACIPLTAIVGSLVGVGLILGEARDQAGEVLALCLGSFLSLGFWFVVVVLASRALLWWESRRERRDGVAATALPAVTPLHRHWQKAGPSAVLAEFLSAFEASVIALGSRMSLRVGSEAEDVLPFHQQVSLAEQLGVWPSDDVASWQECLRLRHEILTAGRVVSLKVLLDRSSWLTALAARTVPHDSRRHIS